MKPSSLLKYCGWGIVDSPSERPRQTADLFFYLNQFLLFQGSYVYGHDNHDLLHVIMFQKKSRCPHDQGPYKMQNFTVPFTLRHQGAVVSGQNK